jgi:NADH-quinone oxidoreductase subunit G
MVKVTIDGIVIEVKSGTTILEAASQAGIKIPTLCFLKEINEVAACRVCVVEIEGASRLAAACNTPCEDGMVIRTNSKRVRNARKANVKLILSQHKTSCTTCIRDGNCSLQEITKELNLFMPVDEVDPRPFRWDANEPLVRDDAKCIQCFRCYNECEKVQDLAVWDVIGTGRNSKIGISPGKGSLREICSLCGQCITHCPTGALTARDDTAKFYAAVDDPDLVTVVQIAPAVRSAYGEMIGLPDELATEKRMAAAVKALGVDYVFDTNFTADLTIMEEGSEFLEFLGKKGELPKFFEGEANGKDRCGDLPMFTSCCPGWVRYFKIKHPEILPQLSTAKSPQQMFGAVTKTYFAERIGVDPSKVFCISIMPCSAKKYECDVEAVNDACKIKSDSPSLKDVDMVLTTRELSRLLRSVNVAGLKEIDFDSPLGTGTGAAVIFGRTGGVMEAALRSAYYLVVGENPDPKVFCQMSPDGEIAGEDRPWREAVYQVGPASVRVAVTSGLANAGRLVEALKRGDVSYDFVEIMACPGGCAGGGGQPIHDGQECAYARGGKLDTLDVNNALRYSHENPDVVALYNDYLEKPLSHMSHVLLHTDQTEWKL